MTYPISDVTRRIVYSGSAGTGPYSFSFEILAQTDIAVYKNTTLLTLTTDYTVTINVDGTGSITLVSAATGEDQITIVGDRGIARATDFVTGGDLFANSLNDEFDSLVIFAQQVDEKADRGLKAPVTDPTDVNMELPAKADRKGTVLAFNEVTGDPQAGPSIADTQSVADNIAAIATLAPYASDIPAVAAVASDIPIVADGLSSSTATGVAYFNASNVLSSSTNLAFDDTTKMLTIDATIKPILRLAGDGNNANDTVYGEIQFYNKDLSRAAPNTAASIRALSAGSFGNGGQLSFSTSPYEETTEGAAPIQRFFIDDNGNSFFYSKSGTYASFQWDSDDTKVLISASGVAGDGGDNATLSLGAKETSEVTFTSFTAKSLKIQLDETAGVGGQNAKITHSHGLSIFSGSSTNNAVFYANGNASLGDGILYADNVNNRVGVGTTTPATRLSMSGASTYDVGANGSITGTTLTINFITHGTGTFDVGDLIFGDTVEPGTRITALGTGTGGAGTYEVSISQTTGTGYTMWSSAYGSNILRINSTSTDVKTGQPEGIIQFYGSDATSPGAGVSAYIASVTENTSPDSSLVFGTRSASSGSVDANEVMRISSTGDVTIAGNLTVQGTTVTLDNATVQTFTWGDNDKAIFGDGSDLQIYHDGTTSKIDGAVTLTGNVTLGDASTDTVTVNGYMGVGGAANASAAIRISSSSLTGTGQVGVDSRPVGTSSSTTAVASYWSIPGTAAAAFTVNNVYSYFAYNAIKGAGSTINSLHGLYVADQTQGTNNYGITSAVSSGTNKWNIYASGTAANYFAGNVLLGTTTATSGYKLNVAGGAIRLMDASSETNAAQIETTSTQTIFQTRYSTPLILGTSATERLRIDSAGNLGLGVPPSAWNSLSRAFQFGTNGIASLESYNSVSTNIANNYYRDSGGQKYATTALATMYSQFGGAHYWYTAPSGTAGAAISFTQAMTLTADGNLGIGTTSPYVADFSSGSLGVHIKSGSSYGVLKLESPDNKITWLATGSAATYLYVKDANPLVFGTNNTARARITSAGDLLVGKTTASSSIAGGQINANGTVIGVRDGASAAIFNRLTSDGEVISIRKSGTTVGSIGVADNGDRIYLGGSGANRGIAIDSSASVLMPSTNTGGIADGLLGLGTSTSRFTDLYLSGGVYVGGTGAANHLDDYEEGTWTPSLQGVTATYTTQTGTYTKIGRQVTCSVLLVVSSLDNTDASGFSVNIPFTSSATAETAVLFSATTRYNKTNLIPDTATTFLNSGARLSSSGTVGLRAPYSSTTDTTPRYNELNASGEVSFSFSYYV